MANPACQLALVPIQMPTQHRTAWTEPVSLLAVNALLPDDLKRLRHAIDEKRDLLARGGSMRGRGSAPLPMRIRSALAALRHSTTLARSSAGPLAACACTRVDSVPWPCLGVACFRPHVVEPRRSNLRRWRCPEVPRKSLDAAARPGEKVRPDPPCFNDGSGLDQARRGAAQQ
jgi:hypothetical protein